MHDFWIAMAGAFGGFFVAAVICFFIMRWVAERCRTAEVRVRENYAMMVTTFPLTVQEQDCCPTELGRAMARDLSIARSMRGLNG